MPDSSRAEARLPPGAMARWILGTHPRIVLVSSSPRRRETLEILGIPARVEAVTIDESFGNGESPEAGTVRVARAKADAAAAAGARGLLLAADTVVARDGEIFGKPRDREDARRMLRALSGREHRVVTGVVLRDTERGERSGAEATGVSFRPLSEGEIDDYLDSGEPFDKAGAYGIQGLGALLVSGVRGDYTNVVGLPVSRLLALARSLHEGKGSP